MTKKPKPPKPSAPEPPTIDVPVFSIIASPEIAEMVLNIDACPTCGTAKTANRCEVCGHQEKDT